MVLQQQPERLLFIVVQSAAGDAREFEVVMNHHTVVPHGDAGIGRLFAGVVETRGAETPGRGLRVWWRMLMMTSRPEMDRRLL